MTRDANHTIAAVSVDVSLPHLDRTFDYRIPPQLLGAVGVGMRVRVVFAGKLKTGIVMSLHSDASHATAEIRALVSPAVVLAPVMAALVRAVADRYAGTFADVVRFAVPPRHAKSEADALLRDLPAAPMPASLTSPLSDVRGMSAFLDRASRGESVAACVEIPARLSLYEAVVDVALAVAANSSVVIVLPDVRDVDAVMRRLESKGATPIAIRAADGPAVRQRAFTVASRLQRGIVVGTRTSVFAPVHDAGVTIVVGDGNDSLVEAQSPGWHAREVALLRGTVAGWSTLLMARHRSIEVQAEVELGRVKPLAWASEHWRSLSTRVEAVPERYEGADPMLQRLRIPPSVFKAIRQALTSGPVVLSVAHRGYVSSVRCAGCKETARCAQCGGAIAIATGTDAPRCTLCGMSGWQCPWCSATAVRFQTIGVERTREELGRAFPSVPVRVVDADHPLDAMGSEPSMLFVTPGMEPEGQAALAVILDADLMLARHDLSAPVEALRRWLDVVATVGDGARVLIVGSPSAPAVQALVRNDPIGFAERELQSRRSAGLPPARHAAVVTAPQGVRAVDEIREALPQLTVLGPVALGDQTRWVLLSSDCAELTTAVRSMIVKRSAAKTLAGISMRIDPLELAT